MKTYLGGDKARRKRPIASADDLGRFIETRSNHVAQTSLYGYLKTRAGTRHLELFSNDDFIEMLNVAKWQVWAACISDLAVFSGGHLAREGHDHGAVRRILKSLLEAIFVKTGAPTEAGPDFPGSCARALERIDAVDWSTVTDDDAPFSESPDALVKWAPIMPTLMELDADVVRNSVRYRWQEIRRDFRRDLRADEVMGAAGQIPAQTG